MYRYDNTTQNQPEESTQYQYEYNATAQLAAIYGQNVLAQYYNTPSDQSYYDTNYYDTNYYQSQPNYDVNQSMQALAIGPEQRGGAKEGKHKERKVRDERKHRR